MRIKKYTDEELDTSKQQQIKAVGHRLNELMKDRSIIVLVQYTNKGTTHGHLHRENKINAQAS